MMESTPNTHHEVAPEVSESKKGLDIFNEANACVLDETTLGAIFGEDIHTHLAKAKSFNTNNDWVNFRDDKGVLRAMPFSKEVATELSNRGYQRNPSISVIDSNIITKIQEKRQEGNNPNFAKSFENGILASVAAGEARKAEASAKEKALDDKYRV